MKYDIVLLFPPDTNKPYRELEDAGSLLPPVGISYIAGFLREKGIKTSIVDAYAEKLTIHETVERIVAVDPGILGISLTSAVVFIADEVARQVKQKLPSTVIVVGGPHVSAVPEETMNKIQSFDIAVFGEGELTCLELIQKLKSDNYKINELGSVDGIIYRNDSGIVKTKPRQYIEDLDILPFPAFDMLPELSKFYTLPGDNIKRLPATSLVTSRGCPKDCIFCDRSTFGRRFRSHSNEYLIRLMKHLIKEYGIRDIGFYDDNLMANPPKLREFCKLLIKEKLDLTWSCEGSVDFATEESLWLMKAAGCWQIAWGLESGSQKMLDMYRKRITVEQMEKVLKMADKAGIDNRGFFIVGGFSETKETIEETLNFIRRTPLVNFHITYFTVYPGSEAARSAGQYGIYEDDWRLLNSLTPNFAPSTITREELERYYKKFYAVFYFRPRIVWYFFLKLLKEPAILGKLWKSFIALCKFTFRRGS